MKYFLLSLNAPTTASERDQPRNVAAPLKPLGLAIAITGIVLIPAASDTGWVNSFPLNKQGAFICLGAIIFGVGLTALGFSLDEKTE